VTLMCHPFGKLRTISEAKPKDEILRFAQNDSFAVTLGILAHIKYFLISFLVFTVCT